MSCDYEIQKYKNVLKWSSSGIPLCKFSTDFCPPDFVRYGVQIDQGAPSDK